MSRIFLVTCCLVSALAQCQCLHAQFISSSRPPSPIGGTLDFVNVTATRINQTQPEQLGNEKEIEFGDFDNDGDPDVVVAVALSDFVSRQNKLYRNDNGVFNEVSATSVIPGFSRDEVTRNAFFRDYDNDGWLDLVTVSDSNNGDRGITRYYANKHPGGVFSHFADETSRLNGAGGAACSAVSFDVDNDGDIDLYLGNYPFNSQDTLYLNDGTGNFTDVTNTHVPTEQDYTLDVHHGDLNNDGKTDMVVTSAFGDASYLVYNDLNQNGSAIGDFKYSGSRHNVGTTNIENAAEIADFNNDGRLDIYFANKTDFTDRVWVNTGNAANGQAEFNEINLSGFVSSTESRKATAVDLNRDGRVDVIVMGENRRPAILRNTSVNGDVSFVDWSPAPAFPNGSSLGGWHANATDVTNDGRPDIFLGGDSDDHLFENRNSAATKEASLGGNLPSIHNGSPIAIFGNGVAGEVDEYDASSLPNGARVSIVLTSKIDVALEVVRSNGSLVASSDRGGAGIEEALEVTVPANSKIRVRNQSSIKGKRSYRLEVLSRN